MSDIQHVVGTTAALHLASVTVKWVYNFSTKSGVHHIKLVDIPEVFDLIESRGLARISGPVSVSFVGPVSADAIIGSTVAVVPDNVQHWPTAVSQIANVPTAVNFSASSLNPLPTGSLPFASFINKDLKPRPLAGRHPALLFGWSVESTRASVPCRFEFTIPIEFDGIDWVLPRSWIPVAP